jgi:hypothetical protein
MNLPQHILEQLDKLIKEGLPPEEIAFLLQLDIDVVKEAQHALKPSKE